MNAVQAETMQVSLPQFTGPLELLYFLIRRHELEISEVSLAVISDEFAASVDEARELNLPSLGQYLVIAATLMYLKSKWLLPPEEEPQDGSDQESEVAPLLQQLADMEKFREVVHSLGLNEDRARATFPRPLTSELSRRLGQLAEREPFIDVSSFELLKAMRRIQEFAFPAARVIVRETVNLEEKVAELFSIIKIRLKLSLTAMLGATRTNLERAVLFLASLELARQKVLRLRQTENFGEIEATARDTTARDLTLS